MRTQLFEGFKDWASPVPELIRNSERIIKYGLYDRLSWNLNSGIVQIMAAALSSVTQPTLRVLIWGKERIKHLRTAIT
jgi:hypothetical protein